MDVDRPKWGSTLVKNHDENKTYILVKLSESFSNAIQEYSTAQSQNHHSNNNIHHHLQNGSNNNHKRPKLQHNNINYNNNHHHQDKNSNSHANNNLQRNNNVNQQIEAPTIKFQGTRGAIRFPSGKTYDFSLEHSDNSVECIRQTKNKCESIGKVACCLHVKGKDDVYQRTRTKMEAAEQEKRKYCTKLLGSPENNTTTTTASSASSSSSTTTTTTASSTTITASSTKTTASSSTILERSLNHSVTPAPTSSKPSSKLLDNNTSSTNATTITPAASNNSTNTTTSTTSKSYLLSSPHVNLSKYPDITDVKQLKKYKADFDKDYMEYQNLHGYLHRIEERFQKLRESLRQSVEGSTEWESAKEQIFNEYERVKSDSNFHRARSKYKQLYDKLAHIKEKIFQFKRQQKDKFKKK